ncbi:MAG: hydroxypyruvate isomerase family protein [Chloroflexota bacterium]
MTRVAANIGFLFREVPWLDRFSAAREAGFDAVEFGWPAASARDVVAAVRRERLAVALLNMPAGDLDAGDRGYPNDPARREEWRADLDRALDLASDVECRVVNVLAGNRLDDVPLDAQLAVLDENIAWALPRARARAVTLVVELLNAADTPRYLVTTLEAATTLLDRLAADGLRLQFDTYHVAHVEPDVARAFRGFGDRVAHIQVADRPGRHEPGSGAIDWEGFIAAIEASRYDGAIGFEYVPSSTTAESLARLRELTSFRGLVPG